MSDRSRGRCHCGAVMFEARGRPRSVLQCNCSICAMKGYLHWIVPREDFRLLTPESALATYRFGTQTAKHHFCATCGITPFYIARSDPDKIDINARCVDGLELATLAIEPFDGQNWERAYEHYRHPPDGSDTD